MYKNELVHYFIVQSLLPGSSLLVDKQRYSIVHIYTLYSAKPQAKPTTMTLANIDTPKHSPIICTSSSTTRALSPEEAKEMLLQVELEFQVAKKNLKILSDRRRQARKASARAVGRIRVPALSSTSTQQQISYQLANFLMGPYAFIHTYTHVLEAGVKAIAEPAGSHQADLLDRYGYNPDPFSQVSATVPSVHSGINPKVVLRSEEKMQLAFILTVLTVLGLAFVNVLLRPKKMTTSRSDPFQTLNAFAWEANRRVSHTNRMIPGCKRRQSNASASKQDCATERRTASSSNCRTKITVKKITSDDSDQLHSDPAFVCSNESYVENEWKSDDSIEDDGSHSQTSKISRDKSDKSNTNKSESTVSNNDDILQENKSPIPPMTLKPRIDAALARRQAAVARNRFQQTTAVLAERWQPKTKPDQQQKGVEKKQDLEDVRNVLRGYYQSYVQRTARRVKPRNKSRALLSSSNKIRLPLPNVHEEPDLEGEENDDSDREDVFSVRSFCHHPCSEISLKKELQQHQPLKVNAAIAGRSSAFDNFRRQNQTQEQQSQRLSSSRRGRPVKPRRLPSPDHLSMESSKIVEKDDLHYFDELYKSTPRQHTHDHDDGMSMVSQLTEDEYCGDAVSSRPSIAECPSSHVFPSKMSRSSHDVLKPTYPQGTINRDGENDDKTFQGKAVSAASVISSSQLLPVHLHQDIENSSRTETIPTVENNAILPTRSCVQPTAKFVTPATSSFPSSSKPLPEPPIAPLNADGRNWLSKESSSLGCITSLDSTTSSGIVQRPKLNNTSMLSKTKVVPVPILPGHQQIPISSSSPSASVMGDSAPPSANETKSIVSKDEQSTVQFSSHSLQKATKENIYPASLAALVKGSNDTEDDEIDTVVNSSLNEDLSSCSHLRFGDDQNLPKVLDGESILGKKRSMSDNSFFNKYNDTAANHLVDRDFVSITSAPEPLRLQNMVRRLSLDVAPIAPQRKRNHRPQTDVYHERKLPQQGPESMPASIPIENKLRDSSAITQTEDKRSKALVNTSSPTSVRIVHADETKSTTNER